MGRFMGSSDDYEGQSSRGGRKRPYRHSLFQTEKLEAYFKLTQHPNERERCQLGREVGLTPTQIKFWFQNKRTLSKAQSGRLEGNALRAENERIRYENLAIIDALNNGLCKDCKGLPSTKEEHQQRVDQLKIENSQLNAEYYRLTNFLVKPEIAVAGMNSSPEVLNGNKPQFLPIDNDFNSKNLSCELTWDEKPKSMQELDNTHQMVQIVRGAIEELTALMTIETLWLKDPTDGRYIIHRPNYEKTFLRNSHLNNNYPLTQIESSRKEGLVKMNGPQLVAMLQNPSKRMELFPTIITKAMTALHLEAGSSSLNGNLQLVHEQIHILSPFITPREFDLIRYSEQVDEGAWIIVDVSHNLSNDDKLQTFPFRSWKFPSGCLIKDLSNGFTKITWVEHMEVDDKASTHHLFRNVIFRGLGYGAERYIFSLERMCDRISSQMGESPMIKEVEEGRKSIMNLTQRMMKDMCTKLSMKTHVEIPQLSQLNNSETRVNVYKNTGPGQPNGVIISAATSFWIPFSYQEVFNFLTSTNKRSQWDAFTNGYQLQEIASITYGNDSENRLSIIQPVAAGDTNTLVVQESCMDLQGGIIVYAPVNKKVVEMVLNGEDSSNIPILTSGFIISHDGNTHIASRDGASSSTASQIGSVLTVVLQILPCDGSTSEEINALISSNIKKIKFSLGSNLE